MGEDLDKKIEEVERCHSINQAAQSWRLIRELTGKGSSQSCQINGDTADDRLQAWHNHYKSLLGNPPVIDNEEEDVVPIYKELPIEVGPFTNVEYQKAKRSLKAGKSCGEDGIVPDILKWVPIDDLILTAINNVYTGPELPERWRV